MTVSLSPLEEQVMAFLFTGAKHQTIANMTGRSIDSVRWSTKRIYDKLGASNRVGAVTFAIHHGILHGVNGYYGA